MKLKTTLVSYGVMSVVFAGILGIIGYWAIHKLNTSLNSIVSSNAAVQAQMQADIMHDYLQSDVLGLGAALDRADSASVKAMQADIETHGKNLKEHLAKAAAFKNTAELEKTFDAAILQADAYVASAKEMGNIAMSISATQNLETEAASGSNRLQAFDDKLPKFTAEYQALERVMGRLKEDMDQYNAATVDIGNKAGSFGKKAIITGFVLVVVLATLIARYLRRRTMKTIGGEPSELLETANEIASGNLANNVNVQAGDTNSLFAAISKMQSNLRNNFEATSKKAQEMLQIKTALDSVPMNLRIANKEGNITYINQALINTIKRSITVWREKVPDFDADNLLGRSISIFYDDPQMVNNLKNLRGQMESDRIFDGRTYKIITTPIFNEQGENEGTVGQWVDKTDELRTQKELSELVLGAATGDLSQRISLDGKVGFYYDLAHNINQMVESTDGVINETVAALERIANGDMTQQIETQYQGAYALIKDNANLTIQRLTDIVSEIKAVAHATNVSATEIAAGNIDLSQRTEEQASSLEETASSMEQMASTVKQNADNARQANMMATEASQVAIKGGKVVSEVVTTMSEINTSSKKIVDIISVIDGIAFQTNILALNAAVEAARAGEQGRGFAVVATEVRNLAQRSAAAAKEIKQLIGDSVNKVAGGTKLVEDAGKTMDEIVNAVKKVTDIVNEIASASMEQSAGIDQVNNAITNMDEVTQQNAALVEQAAAAAASMEQQTQDLIDSVAVFKLRDDAEERTSTMPTQSALRKLSQPKAIASVEAQSKQAPPNKSKEKPSQKQNGKRASKPNNSPANEDDWEEF
jgi:methyl-accepting chemotaxis protein